jgi:ATP-dependent Clp protease ATP-binding subunit ClpC
MFERFTDRTRRAVVLAQEEARLLGHGYIGTEHILLGLLHEREGIAAKALDSLEIGLEAAREQTVQILSEAKGKGRGKRNGPQAAGGHIPFTPRAKKVLELSLREALQLSHKYIGTEHILLGLLREGEGVAVQVLTRLGADRNEVRRRVMQIVYEQEAQADPEAAAGERVTGGGPRPSPLGRADPGLTPGLTSRVDALESRLSLIEQRVGTGPDAAGLEPPLAAGFRALREEVERLSALLREHGIDPS